MFDLFLPLVIGVAVGIELPPESEAPMVEIAATQAIPDEDVPMVVDPPAQAVPSDMDPVDDLVATREPEPQIPTGKFTTAMEVRPILGMTKNNWIGVREYEGQDLIYFSHLLSWRCGLWDIRYGINGEPATNVVAMEPCNEELGQPNAMIDVANFLPFVSYPLGSVESVYVEIEFDDGTTDFAQFGRDQVRIP